MKALVANEELQTGLVADARTASLHRLMQGFIGECKAVMISSQQPSPAQSPPKPESEILISFFLFFFFFFFASFFFLFFFFFLFLFPFFTFLLRAEAL